MRKAALLLLAAFVARGHAQWKTEDVIHRIEKRRSRGVIVERSDTSAIRDVMLICIKEDRKLELWINGGRVKAYPMTAFSGGPGPKVREGDRQIPEGLYSAVHLNPNSAYYLSIKVSYPNAWDLAWAKQEKRENLGGDIFIHGENVTIGCIPIGNRAIEEVFWAVYKAGTAKTRILISPVDFRKPGKRPPGATGKLAELYRNIRMELLKFRVNRDRE